MPSPSSPTNPVEDGAKPRRGWGSVTTYWYGLEPPHTLAIFRILLGSYFLIGWLNAIPWITFFYSSAGIPFPLLRSPEGDVRSLVDLLAVVTQPPEPWLAWVLCGFMILLSVLIVVGCCTRAALTIYAVMSVYYWLLHLHTVNTSYDRLALIAVVLMAFSECDAVFSVESWYRKRRGQPPVEFVPIWPARLIAVQIAFMYLGTGIYKVTSPSWNEGTILQYSLQGDWGSSLSFWLLQFNWNPMFFSAGVLMTILLEVWAPFLLFHPQLRYLFFVVGTLFHLGIALLLNIWGFMLIPLTYIVFVDPRACQRYCEKLAADFRKRRQPVASPEPTNVEPS